MDQPTRDLLVVNSQLPPIVNLGAQTPDTLQIWTDCGIRFACFCPKKRIQLSFSFEHLPTTGDGTILNNVNQVFTLRTPRNTVVLLVSCP